MSVVCSIDKSTRDWKENVRLFGENSAEYLHNVNNQKDLDMNRNGTKSSLFKAVARDYGEDVARIEKARVYDHSFTKEFGEWYFGKGRGLMSADGEPKILYLNQGRLNVLSEFNEGADVNEIGYITDVTNAVRITTESEITSKNIPIGYMDTNQGRIYYVNPNQLSRIYYSRKSDTRAIQDRIASQLFSAEIIDYNYKEFTPGVALNLSADTVEEINTFISNLYNVGQFIYQNNNGYFVNDDAFRKIGEKLASGIRQIDSKQNKVADQKLNDVIKATLRAAGIEVEMLSRYSDWFLSEFNQIPSAETVAVLTNKLILISNTEDSLSLSKAAAHFIVEALWDQPGFAELRTGYLTSTEEYRQALLQEPDRLRAQKNAIADILGKYIAERGRTIKDTALNRIVGYLKGWLDRIKTLFSREKITVNTIPDHIRQIYGKSADWFLKGGQDVSSLLASVNTSTVAAKPSDNFYNPLEQTLDEITRGLKDELNELMIEEVGLYNKEIRDRYEKYSDEFGSNLTEVVSRMSELENKIKLAESQEERNLLLKEMGYLREYLGLDEAIQKDKDAAKRVKELSLRLSRVSNSLLNKEYEYGLFLFLFGYKSRGVTSNGAYDDMAVAKTLMDTMSISAENALALDDGQFLKNYKKLLSLYRHYSSVITPVRNAVVNGSWVPGELTADQIVKLKEGVKDIADKVLEIGGFLDKVNASVIRKFLDVHNDDKNSSGIPVDHAKLAHQMANGHFGDISKMALWGGSVLENPLAFINVVVKKVIAVKNRVHRKAEGRANEFLRDYFAIIDRVKSNPVVIAYMDKFKSRNVEGLLMERDAAGSITGNILSEWNLKTFEDAKKEYMAKLYAKIEANIKSKYKVSLAIPVGDTEEEAEERKRVIYGGNFSTSEVLKKDGTIDREKLKKITREIRTTYEDGVHDWYLKNTEPLEDWKDIVEDMKKSMNQLQFEEWKKYHVYSVNNFGTVVEFPKGSLVVPAKGGSRTLLKKDEDGSPYAVNIKQNDYSNKDYDKLIAVPEFKTLYDSFIKYRDDAMALLPARLRYSQEIYYRLPQMSKSILDNLSQKGGILGNLRRAMNEAAGDAVRVRADDEIHKQIEGPMDEMLIVAPVRFISPLEVSAERVSDELASTFQAFHEMALTYKEHLDNSSLYQIATDVVSRSNFAKHWASGWSTFFTKKNTIAGNKSNIYNQLLEFLETEVKQDRVLGGTVGKFDFSKLIRSITRFASNVNLQFNLIAMSAGFLTAEKELVIESFMNKLGVRDSVGSNLPEANAELLKNITGAIRDFEQPLTNNKLLAFNRHHMVTAGNRSRYNNISKHLVTRILTESLDFPGWKQFDFIVKTTAAIAVAKNRRYIDGKWYTEQSYQGDKSKWNKAVSYYDVMEVKDYDFVPKAEYAEVVTEDIKDEITNELRILNSRIDGVPLSEDRSGVIFRNLWAQASMLHQNWIIQALARRLKRRHFNVMSNQYEEGYYISFGQLAKQAVMNYQNLGGIVRLAKSDPVYKEALFRIGMDVAMSYFTYMTAMLVNGWADEDDEESFVKQFFAYLATRFYLESHSVAPLGMVNESADRIMQPFASISGTPLTLVAGAFSYLYIAALGSDNNKDFLQSGPWKGHSKAFKQMVKSTPYYSHFYQDFIQGGESFEAKNRLLRNQIITPPLGFDRY